MSDTPLSESDVRAREQREAYIEGAHDFALKHAYAWVQQAWEEIALKRYPPPTRPRVLIDAVGCYWKRIDGKYYSGFDAEWSTVEDVQVYLTDSRIDIWHALKAEPNEPVPEDREL